MSRELKRVPLNFNAPLKQTWKGYVNPYLDRASECMTCAGSGSSLEFKYLHDQWYGYVPFDPWMTASTPLTTKSPAVRAFAERQINRDPRFYGTGEEAIEAEARRVSTMWNRMWSHHLDKDDVEALLKKDRLWDFTRRPRTEEQKARLEKEKGNFWMRETNGYVPTPQEVNDWNILTVGHDAINAWVCVAAKAERLGYKERHCSICKGEGRVWDSPYYKRRYASWKPTNPPRGKGFQLWENCSEGSPVSPVFKTLEELAEWCATGATTFGSFRATAAEWMKMLDENHVYHQEGNAVYL